MIRIFPRVTKCRFYKYGPSANIETIDALCLLPLNIVNEKIYIFLWFWFLGLTALTSAVILFRLIIIACPPVRVYMLSLRFKLGSLDHLHTIVRKMSIGDWFLGKRACKGGGGRSLREHYRLSISTISNWHFSY